MLLLPHSFDSPEFHTLKAADKEIDFFALLPLYEQEVAVKLNKGLEILVDRLDKQGITQVVDVNRRNTCGRFWQF